MTVLSNSFEGGSDETLISEANSGGSSGNPFSNFYNHGQLRFDTARAAVGVFSARNGVVAGDASALGWFDEFGNPTEYWVRLYYYATQWTGSYFEFVTGSTGGTPTHAATTETDSTGHLLIRDSNQTQQGISSGTLPTNQWVRVEMHVVVSDSSGVIEARFYETPDAAVEAFTEEVSASGIDTLPGDPVNEVHVGLDNQVASSWVDEIAYSSVAWLGPALPAIPSPTTIYPPVVGGRW